MPPPMIRTETSGWFLSVAKSGRVITGFILNFEFLELYHRIPFIVGARA
jgi:hypothetical protein